jgi:hypothetical protein
VDDRFATNGAPNAILRSSQPILIFAQAVGLLMPDPAAARHRSDELIAADATIGADVDCAPSTYRLLARRLVLDRVYPNVVIGPLATVGDDCVPLRTSSRTGPNWQPSHPAGWRRHWQRWMGFVKQADGTRRFRSAPT